MEAASSRDVSRASCPGGAMSVRRVPWTSGLRALGLWVVKQKPCPFVPGSLRMAHQNGPWGQRPPSLRDPKEQQVLSQTCLGLTAGGQGLGSRWPLRDLAAEGDQEPGGSQPGCSMSQPEAARGQH